MTELNIQAASWTGPVRENNEDMASVCGVLLRDESTSLEASTEDCGYLYLFVADGMGGHEKGEYASKFLQEHLRDCFTMGDIAAETFVEDITREVGYVAAKLNARSRDEGMARPMGTTLAGVVFFDDRIWLVGVGDSRTYRFRDGFLTLLSRDHENVDGKLTNCVGAGVEPFVEVKDITSEVADDDVLLICSDGLSDMVPDDEIEYLLIQSGNPLEVLYDRACDNGGSDNFSAILAKVGGGDFGYGDEGPDDDGRWDAYA